MKQAGHTLIEVITVVLVLSALTSVAVIRLHPDVLPGVQADAAIRQIATSLRRTRSEALLHAARNPAGFALVIEGQTGRSRYRIVNLQDSTSADEGPIAEGIRCAGGRRFEFGPLGNLMPGSDRELHVSTDTRKYTLEIVPATGAVKWTQDKR